MIHKITKAFDERDERGIDRNIWMKLYETSDIYDKHDNIYHGILANGYDFNSAMNIISVTKLAIMVENLTRSHQ